MGQDLEINFNDYMTIYEIAEEKFNKKPNNYYFIYKLEESISKLPAECKISKVEFREKYYVEKYDKNIKNLYLKEDVKRFFRNYVPKASLKAKLKKVVSDATIHKYYKKLNPTEIILGGNLDVFVSIEIAQELTEIINTVAGVYCKIKVQTCAKNLYRVLHYFCA